MSKRSCIPPLRKWEAYRKRDTTSVFYTYTLPDIAHYEIGSPWRGCLDHILRVYRPNGSISTKGSYTSLGAALVAARDFAKHAGHCEQFKHAQQKGRFA